MRASTAKAWVGATLAAVSAASVALENGRISWGEVPIIISAFVAGYQGVYWTTNKVGDRKAQIDK